MKKLIKDTLSITVKKEGEGIEPTDLASILMQYNGMIKFIIKELVGADTIVSINEYSKESGKIVFGVKELCPDNVEAINQNVVNPHKINS